MLTVKVDWMAAQMYGTLTLFGDPIPGDLSEHHQIPTIACTTIPFGFRLGLFPVHSPLLGESLLLSFPVLSDMLKFST